MYNSIMNKNNINKFQFFLLFLLFDLLILTIVHVTVFDGYHYGEYTVGHAVFSAETQKKSLEAAETVFRAETTYIDKVNLVISDLPQDRAGFLKIQLEHGDNVLYTGNQPLNMITPNEWFSVRLGVSLNRGDQYRLVVTSNGVTSLPSIYLSDGGITPVLSYTYKKDLSLTDKVFVIAYYCVLYLIGALLILKYKKALAWFKRVLVDSNVQNWSVGPYAIVNSLVAALALYGSKLAVPDDTLFYFFEISILVSGIWLENNFTKVKDEYLSSIIH